MVWPQVYIIFEMKMFVNVPRNPEPFLENVAELQLGISDNEVDNIFDIIHISRIYERNVSYILDKPVSHTHVYGAESAPCSDQRTATG